MHYKTGKNTFSEEWLIYAVKGNKIIKLILKKKYY